MILSTWQYHNPVDIHFGPGLLSRLPDLIRNDKAFLITTPGTTKRGVVESLKNSLNHTLLAIYDDVQPNPTFADVKDVYKYSRTFAHTVLIALGGGSVLDTAKAVAAMMEADSEDWIEDHLKGGCAFPKNFGPKPVIAVPTTAGTGSEVTMWATVWDMQEKKKFSISHPRLYPRKAILDPNLTGSLPRKETVYSGLDALSHAMEAIWNKRNNPVSDCYALDAIATIHDVLPKLQNDLANMDLRCQIMRASLFAGLAFSNTKTALAHSISYPLTTHFGIPHGFACSIPLPHVLELNGAAYPDRIKIMSGALRSDTSIEALKGSLVSLFERLDTTLNLADYGVAKQDLEEIARASLMSGRASNNLVNMDQRDLVTFLGRFLS